VGAGAVLRDDNSTVLSTEECSAAVAATCRYQCMNINTSSVRTRSYNGLCEIERCHESASSATRRGDAAVDAATAAVNGDL